MKLVRILPFALALLMGSALHAQTDPVIIEIGDQKIHKSEFMGEFLKSIGQDPAAAPTACTYEKRKALEEYVELFTNFRVKLMDAEARHLDTILGMRRELALYRRELSSPYLIDSATMRQILEEAYERNQYALHASHVLVKLDVNANPDDTLAAYKKAMEIYQKAMSGDDFGQLAWDFSDDPSARGDELRKREGNRGDIGYFTVFQMVYPFESAAYALQPGEVSKPVRTQFGYHIIKLHERTPYFGKISLQHIWIGNQHEDAEHMAQEAYKRIANGESFALVAKTFSDDRNENGGFASNLEVKQMPTDYVTVISTLKEGESSKPFKTKLGWHIVRLVQRETIPAFDDMAAVYKQRLSRDKRSEAPRTVFAEQCRGRYGFRDFTQEKEKAPKGKKGPVAYKASLSECVAAVNDSVYMRMWKFNPSSITDLRPLFEIAGKHYNAVDLLSYVEHNQYSSNKRGQFDTYIQEQYQNFINEKAILVADSLLEHENEEFKALMKEYRDGLLIFAYNDRMVWGKAVADTVGLQAFYEREHGKHSFDNPDDDAYFWKTRAHVMTIHVADSAVLAPQKAKKVVDKCLKQGTSMEALQAMLRKAAKSKLDTTGVAVRVTDQMVEEGSSDLLRKNEWQRGVYDRPNTKGYRLLVVDRTIDPGHKTVREARGYYISDYQNYLDAQLIKELREKYNVKVHQNVVDEIVY